jgi:hypothetical protein
MKVGSSPVCRSKAVVRNLRKASGDLSANTRSQQLRVHILHGVKKKQSEDASLTAPPAYGSVAINVKVKVLFCYCLIGTVL